MTDFIVTDGQPVERWYGTLEVPAEGFTGERLRAGALPFCIDHDERKLAGSVTGYRVEGSRLIITVPDDMRSESEAAQDVWPDIDKGVRPGVSPSVMIDEVAVLSAPTDDETKVRAVVWDADEISTVTTPANIGARKMSLGEEEGSPAILFREQLSAKAEAQLQGIWREKMTRGMEPPAAPAPEPEQVSEPEPLEEKEPMTMQVDAIALLKLATEHGMPELGVKVRRGGQD